MTLTEPLISMWPWISAPHSPAMVLFEPTVTAQIEVFLPMVDALADLAPANPRLSAEELAVVVWSSFHGAVVLEVNHHLDWLPDTAALHEKTVRHAFASVGLPEPGKTLRRRFDRWVDRTSA